MLCASDADEGAAEKLEIISIKSLVPLPVTEPRTSVPSASDPAMYVLTRMKILERGLRGGPQKVIHTPALLALFIAELVLTTGKGLIHLRISSDPCLILVL